MWVKVYFLSRHGRNEDTQQGEMWQLGTGCSKTQRNGKVRADSGGISRASLVEGTKEGFYLSRREGMLPALNKFMSTGWSLSLLGYLMIVRPVARSRSSLIHLKSD